MKPTIFQVKLSDLMYRTWFSKPIFGIGGNSKLYTDLYDAYGKFGLRIQDIRLTGLPTNPADVAVALNMLGNRVTITLKPDSFECLVLDCYRLEAEATVLVAGYNQSHNVRELISLGLDCVNSNFGVEDMPTHSFTYTAHCLLEDRKPEEFIQGFLNAPPQGLGNHIGSAVGFYFADTSEQRVSNVTLDRSRLINDGIFFRAEIIYGRSDRGRPDFFDQAFHHFAAILAALSIDFVEGKTP